VDEDFGWSGLFAIWVKRQAGLAWRGVCAMYKHFGQGPRSPPPRALHIPHFTFHMPSESQSQSQLKAPDASVNCHLENGHMNQVAAATLRISWRHRGRHFAFDSRIHLATPPHVTHYIYVHVASIPLAGGGDFHLGIGRKNSLVHECRAQIRLINGRVAGHWG